MANRVMTARYAGTCQDTTCTKPAIKIGDQINYGGKGAVSHAACKPVDAPQTSRRARGSKYAYTSSGARMTERSRRCEDAPCCGCCD